MEDKEKRKRKISVLTIFLWLALIITMSVIVVSGTNKSNALEDTTAEEVGITGVKRVKLDLREVIENEKITEQTEIDAFLEGYKEKIKVSNVNNSTSTVNADITYVGCEKNTIGIYEINIINEAKYIRIEENEYEILNNNEVLELYCNSGKGYYFERLSESINEYNFIVRKKDTKIVTVKMDFGEIIEARGITEQSEIETLLENYASRLTGRVSDDGLNNFINLKSKYVGIEKSTVGVYEVEIASDIKYIQMSKLYDSEYSEFLIFNRCVAYDMLFEGVAIQFVGNRNDYGYISSSYSTPMLVYAMKIIKDIDEYDIKIEKTEDITIKLDEGITKIAILDNTNKIVSSFSGLKDINFKISKGIEYDIIFAPDRIYNDGDKEDIIYKYRGVYEDDKELEQKIEYIPMFNKEINSYYKTIKQGENKSEYNFETSGKFESNIFWEDEKNVKLQFNLREEWKYNDRVDKYADYVYEKTHDYDNRYMIFIENLDENFNISNEYEQNPEWLIVNEEEIKNMKFEIPEYAKSYLTLDIKNNKYIPEYIYASFFEHNFDDFDNIGAGGYIKSNEKIYNIYIKDKNMLYCLVPIDTPNIELSVNLEYNGDKNKEDERFSFNTEAIFLYNESNYSSNRYGQFYIGSTLIEKQIKYNNNKKTRIIVNKSVENNEKNKTYYVGLFENESDNKTDKIYIIDIVNGKGNTKIEFDGYNEEKRYFVYEVDGNGNKIENENLIYNKNRVLETINKKEEYSVLSDKNIISSVYSISANEGYGKNYIFETISEDIGKGKGEEYYKDNSLVATEVYEDIVTISENNEKPYLVRYETKKGGKLEGSLEEVVIEGNKPVNVPNIIVNDGYEFDKWVVIKDGEEVEVNPSEYVVLEDTTFIAKYREIKIEENRDTSDINIWLYVGIAVISIIAIVIVVMIMKINKKRKTLEKR